MKYVNILIKLSLIQHGGRLTLLQTIEAFIKNMMNAKDLLYELKIKQHALLGENLYYRKDIRIQ